MKKKNESESEDWHDELFRVTVNTVYALNSPRRDSLLLTRAKVKIDRALFPLLSIIGFRGPIGVVEIAEIVGRDYTTVSRQMKKLETQGFIKVTRSSKDRRISVSRPTAKGRRMLGKLRDARNSYLDEVFQDWDEDERQAGIEMFRKISDALLKIEP